MFLFRTTNSLLITDTPSSLEPKPILVLSVPSVLVSRSHGVWVFFSSIPEPKPNLPSGVPSVLDTRLLLDREEVHKLRPWVQVALRK